MNKEDLILDRINQLDGKMDLCIKDIAGLKVKSGVWGAIAGMIPVAITLVMWVMGVVP
jgi:hypothetical protein